MKLNWGTGVVISFLMFAGFIGYFVYTIQTQSALQHHLVTESYYKEELKTEAHLRALRNGRLWKDSLHFIKTTRGLEIKPLPDSVLVTIKGYRSNDKAKDFEIEIKVESKTVWIPQSLLIPGQWKISLFWVMDGAEIGVEKPLYYPL